MLMIREEKGRPGVGMNLPKKRRVSSYPSWPPWSSLRALTMSRTFSWVGLPLARVSLKIKKQLARGLEEIRKDCLAVEVVAGKTRRRRGRKVRGGELLVIRPSVSIPSGPCFGEEARPRNRWEQSPWFVLWVPCPRH